MFFVMGTYTYTIKERALGGRASVNVFVVQVDKTS